MGDTTPIPGPSRGLSGSANLNVLVKFVPDQPLLPWQRKFENFNTKYAINTWHPGDLSATSATSPWLVVDIADFLVCLTQTGLLPTCHGNFSNHLDMSWWSETPWVPRNKIHVSDFPVTSRQLQRNFSMTRVIGKYRGSRRNGIWAYYSRQLLAISSKRVSSFISSMQISQTSSSERTVDGGPYFPTFKISTSHCSESVVQKTNSMSMLTVSTWNSAFSESRTATCSCRTHKRAIITVFPICFAKISTRWVTHH